MEQLELVENPTLSDLNAFDTQIKKILPTLTEIDLLKDHSDIRRAIQRYFNSEDGYDNINNQLRKNLNDSETSATIRALDKAFTLLPKSKGDFITYRGLFDDFLRGYKEGDIFKDTGYCSTSPNYQIADYFTLGEGPILKIAVPKGTKCLYMRGRSQSISSLRTEIEILIDRGYNFKIDKIKTIHNKRTYLVSLVTNSVQTTVDEVNMDKEFFQAAIEFLTGRKVQGIDIIPDPKVSDTFAVQCQMKIGKKLENTQWLFIDVDNFSLDKTNIEKVATKNLEETEFTTWPPASGSLRNRAKGDSLKDAEILDQNGDATDKVVPDNVKEYINRFLSKKGGVNYIRILPTQYEDRYEVHFRDGTSTDLHIRGDGSVYNLRVTHPFGR